MAKHHEDYDDKIASQYSILCCKSKQRLFLDFKKIKYQTKSFIRKYKGIFRLKVIRKLFKTNNFIVAYTSVNPKKYFR